MIWYALIIPLLVSVVGYFLYKHKIAWWELFVPTGVSLIAILISFYTMKSITLSDIEYNGYVIVEARYYEYYETWVKKTCSYTTCTGSGKTRNCTTHYYDCSYCDHNSAYWVIIDSGGNEISITEEKYLSLIKKWKATPEFVELNRNIKYHSGCGKDGDMYSIKWNRDIETSETTTYTHEFTNILKCNHSAFNYPIITKEQAKDKGLYNYPEIMDYNKQQSVLGLDSLTINNKLKFKTYMNFLNGQLGASNKVRVYTLFFKDKDINIAFLQEAYWDGGNQNELVVCIGTDVNGNINWVKPFSWCDNKRVIVDTREDIMTLNRIDALSFYNIYKNNIKQYWHYKSFKDFNYLSFEPTTNQLIFVYVLTTIISILLLIWCIKNEIDE